MSVVRYWTTGCLAIVLMAAQQTPARADVKPPRKGTLSRVSQYPLEATVDRLEQALATSDFGLFTSFEDAADRDHPERVLVLANGGFTPIVQRHGANDLGLPLVIRVRALEDGTSVVTVGDAVSLAQESDLPGDLSRAVSRLPRLVERALG